MLWTIEGVCKQWNEVVVSFPELWSFINVIVTDDNFGDDARGIAYARRLGLQLGSVQRITSCRYQFGTIFNVQRLLSYQPAIATILFSFSTRVGRLHLYLPAYVCQHAPIPLFPAINDRFVSISYRCRGYR